MKELLTDYITLQRVAVQCFSKSDLSTIRENVLNHKELRDVIKNKTDFSFFSVYLHGLSKFKVYSEDSIVKFITDYLWPEAPDLQ
jgi:hypothetical protein